MDVSSKVLEISDDNFDKEVLKSDVLVLVDFWAPWCGPCKQLSPILEELSRDQGFSEKAKICKMNIDENSSSAVKYGIQSLPTLAIFKNGEKLDTKVGALPKGTLKEWIESALEK